ncbi:MAG TPA: helix-turn-helix transcriptional regulator [Vicinamibacteria bacterium]
MFRKIGQRIRKVRLEQGIKQKDLARKIGISQGALTNFELGRRKISLEWMLKIARALEVPVAYFMGAVEEVGEAENGLGPREHRLLRAYRRISQDPRLQIELLHVVERVGLHIAKRGGRANRAAAV